MIMNNNLINKPVITGNLLWYKRNKTLQSPNVKGYVARSSWDTGSEFGPTASSVAFCTICARFVSSCQHKLLQF